MTYFYLDASAWVKRYIAESGTEWLGRFWRQSFPTACSVLGLIEVMSAVARRHAMEASPASKTQAAMETILRDFQGFQQVALGRAVLSIAETLPLRFRLRGADCIHLASALFLQEKLAQPVTIIACDAELLRAGESSGLVVVNPQSNPPVPIIQA